MSTYNHVRQKHRYIMQDGCLYIVKPVVDEGDIRFVSSFGGKFPSSNSFHHFKTSAQENIWCSKYASGHEIKLVTSALTYKIFHFPEQWGTDSKLERLNLCSGIDYASTMKGYLRLIIYFDIFIIQYFHNST